MATRPTTRTARPARQDAPARAYHLAQANPDYGAAHEATPADEVNRALDTQRAAAHATATPETVAATPARPTTRGRAPRAPRATTKRATSRATKQATTKATTKATPSTDAEA